ncbi:DUF456 domain-containing protein [Paenarthrobacter sp. Z7-10]|uniref:DUF456 domain-containing protein n=1 Tax=Paenarthrobacter sp. Z7-10 TaxID=2787635 RepID=UPI0022A9BEC6|nr:DUF456 domain-containing protein [Paenarthrobacter sp. Z7-10]MCZ2401633.1 DUF456 domain-containing protein [Paenarthrobacter sp. Z7-10]
MDAALLWTLLCGALILVGMAGIVVPVLPGSVLIGLSLLAWAIAVASPVGWIVFGVGAVLVTAGMLASSVLTGRTMKKRRIPGWSVLAGAVLGIVGFFVIPVVGLLVGFAAGLFLSELIRQRSLAPALSSSVAALKAVGLGILVEFGFGSVAGGTWILGTWIYFAIR